MQLAIANVFVLPLAQTVKFENCVPEIYEMPKKIYRGHQNCVPDISLLCERMIVNCTRI